MEPNSFAHSVESCYATLTDNYEHRRADFQTVRSFHPSSLGSLNATETSTVPHLRLDSDYRRELELIDMIERISNQLDLPRELKLWPRDSQ